MDATGVLLLGGLSRRFGSVKALAPLGSETLAERAWRALGDAFPHRIAVGKEADQLGFPFEVLVAGLRAAQTEIAVFLPVDCPLVTPEALRELAGACAEAAVPPGDPLPGAYAQSALPVLEARLAAGELDLLEALPELDTRTVELDGELLANINTERELDRLRAIAT